MVDFLETKAVLPCVIFTFGKFKCEACGYGLVRQQGFVAMCNEEQPPHLSETKSHQTLPDSAVAMAVTSNLGFYP